MNFNMDYTKPKEIILFDFSKVLSPVGISNYMASSLEKYLTISSSKIKSIYKSYSLCRGENTIDIVVNDGLKKYITSKYTIDDVKSVFAEIPTLDENILDEIQVLSKYYEIHMLSDIYAFLGESLKNQLKTYFDKFWMSYELGYKKTDSLLWSSLSKHIDFQDIKLFIDDKKENTDMAEKFGITSYLYKDFDSDIAKIRKILKFNS